MTTVAYDGNMLATDSRAIGGYIIQEEVSKIIETENGYYAFAGVLIDFEPIVNAYEEMVASSIYDRDGNHLDKGDNYVFSGISISHASAVIHIPYTDINNPVLLLVDDQGCLRVQKESAPCAIGSGSDFAIAAMLSGKTAKEAVEIAAMLDPNTDSNVKVVDFEEKAEELDSLIMQSDVLTAVCHHGSFKKAAEELGMTKQEVKAIAKEMIEDVE